MKRPVCGNTSHLSSGFSGVLSLQIRLKAIGTALLLSLGMANGATSAGQLSNPVLHTPQAMHITQEELNTISDSHARFILAFEAGDELFETTFNALDGVGATVGAGLRFTRIPRADLDGAREWVKHVPPRTTGPNAAACNACHRLPFGTTAGPVEANVIRDPFRTGKPSQMITRNTPHLFGAGALQRLAEEMTTELRNQRRQAINQACQNDQPVVQELSAKGVDFGRITVRPEFQQDKCVTSIKTSQIEGADSDLLIKPFHWKGRDATLRQFNRDAAHNEIGMQAVELVGERKDGDFDGVTNELTVGDITALTVYIAGQPRPVTKLELSRLGQIELSRQEKAAIERGEDVFHSVGCQACHRSQLRLNDPMFSEPSQHVAYRDRRFPAGQEPVAEGVNPENPITFDLTRDHPDNRLEIQGKDVRLGAFETDDRGRAIVRLYGDLKRHDMGAELAESVDELGGGASVFMTKELWGVGSTAPYLHDGRATTLTEAIQAHGGEAAATRDAFAALPTDDQLALIDFLNNLVLFLIEDEEE